jgi:flagella basal body P-ring formation protein FlgA
MRFLLFGLAILSEVALAQAVLRIRPHIIVAPNAQVTLAQLADGQGLSPALLTKMAAVSLSVAPAYGEKQELANANLTAILRPLIQEEKERTGKPVHLLIPKTVVIDTTKRNLDADLVTMEMMQAWQPLCRECQLSIEGLSLPRIDGVRDWTLHLKPEMPRGGFSVAVDLIRENGSATAAWISGRLTIKKKVPVAKRVIGASERVTAQDFTWEYRDTSYAIDGVPIAEEIPGKRLKQGLRANEILWKSMLERERAIRAGETVQLKSAEGDWEISLNMIAQQDAYIGDVINLKNPKTNNILMGQVVGRGEVELR